MKTLIITSLLFYSFLSSSAQIIGKINNDCFVATTETVLDEVIRYSIRKDESRILGLMNKGKVVQLKKGTSVYLVSSGFTVARIKVIGGVYNGQSFYIPVELVTFKR
jgi:hypothetical protein